MDCLYLLPDEEPLSIKPWFGHFALWESPGVTGSEAMKHYTTEGWIDFVNGIGTVRARAEMQKHLDQGCKRCSSTLAQWRKVRRAALAQASSQPPVEAVRIAKAMFIGSEWARKDGTASGIEILFDSFLKPAVEGIRSAGGGARRLLYRADPFRVDLQIEAQLGSKSVVVTGQVLDLRHPESVGSKVPVLVSNMRGQVVQATTNRFGEFRQVIANSGDLELVFQGNDDKPITISLRDVLGQSVDRKG